MERWGSLVSTDLCDFSWVGRQCLFLLDRAPTTCQRADSTQAQLNETTRVPQWSTADSAAALTGKPTPT